MSRIHIISNGTPGGTVIMLDGLVIDGIIEARWEITAEGRATVALVFDDAAIDATGEAATS